MSATGGSALKVATDEIYTRALSSYKIVAQRRKPMTDRFPIEYGAALEAAST